MKILLTGANGFLGSHLKHHWQLNHSLTLAMGRSDFDQVLDNAPNDFDWLVHCGFEVSFYHDGPSFERNVASAKKIDQFMREGKAKRLLFLSAAGVLGVSKGPSLRTENDYGKADQEFLAYRETDYIKAKMACEELFNRSGYSLLTLYLTTIYGDGMPGIQSVLGPKRVNPPGGTSYLGLKDFLLAMDLAIETNDLLGSYIINGSNATYAQIFDAVDLALGRPNKRRVVLAAWARPLIVALAKLGPRGFLSPAILESSFGFKYYSSDKFSGATGWKSTQSFSEMITSMLQQS